METSSETERYINGIRVIHYNPTPLESLRFKMTALRVRKRLEKELRSSGPKLKEKISSEQVLDQLREILEINERTSLQEKIEATGCDY